VKSLRIHPPGSDIIFCSRMLWLKEAGIALQDLKRHRQEHWSLEESRQPAKGASANGLPARKPAMRSNGTAKNTAVNDHLPLRFSS